MKRFLAFGLIPLFALALAFLLPLSKHNSHQPTTASVSNVVESEVHKWNRLGGTNYLDKVAIMVNTNKVDYHNLSGCYVRVYTQWPMGFDLTNVTKVVRNHEPACTLIEYGDHQTFHAFMVGCGLYSRTGMLLDEWQPTEADKAKITKQVEEMLK